MVAVLAASLVFPGKLSFRCLGTAADESRAKDERLYRDGDWSAPGRRTQYIVF